MSHTNGSLNGYNSICGCLWVNCMGIDAVNLFQDIAFISHSGLSLSFKIDCDALTDDDWETLAKLVSERIEFREVHGVPRGGLKFASCLSRYCKPRSEIILIVDDICTTGRSMNEMRNNFMGEPIRNIVGVVVFSRMMTRIYDQTDWITPIFTLHPYFRREKLI